MRGIPSIPKYAGLTHLQTTDILNRGRSSGSGGGGGDPLEVAESINMGYFSARLDGGIIFDAIQTGNIRTYVDLTASKHVGDYSANNFRDYIPELVTDPEGFDYAAIRAGAPGRYFANTTGTPTNRMVGILVFRWPSKPVNFANTYLWAHINSVGGSQRHLRTGPMTNSDAPTNWSFRQNDGQTYSNTDADNDVAPVDQWDGNWHTISFWAPAPGTSDVQSQIRIDGYQVIGQASINTPSTFDSRFGFITSTNPGNVTVNNDYDLGDWAWGTSENTTPAELYQLEQAMMTAYGITDQGPGIIQ